MEYLILLKMVPDVVEELEVGGDGKSLDTEWLRMILSEWCDHALEQGLILKEKYGGTIKVVAIDAPEIDEALYTALAKGADQVVKLTGDYSAGASPSDAEIFSSYLKSTSPPSNETLILTGAQAIDDLEGELPPYLGNQLGIPSIGIITGVSVDPVAKKAVVIKEFAGGLRGEFEISLPAVLGIQGAEKPPRYVPIAKITAAKKSSQIESISIGDFMKPELVISERMYKPEVSGKAEMLEGNVEEVAQKLAGILAEQGII